MDNPHAYQSLAAGHPLRSPKRPASLPSPRPSARLASERGKCTHPTTSLTAQEERRLPLLLRKAWFGLNQAFRRCCFARGITPDQFTVLRILHENAPATLTQRGLADKMCSDANTITSLLARMENLDLIERLADSTDRRARRLNLRPRGRRKFLRVRPLAIALQERMLSALPTARRATFLDDLHLLANTCHGELWPRRPGGVTPRRGQPLNDKLSLTPQ